MVLGQEKVRRNAVRAPQEKSCQRIPVATPAPCNRDDLTVSDYLTNAKSERPRASRPRRRLQQASRSAGRSVVNVRDSGDGRAIVDMSDGTSYGPFTVASGPPGPQGDRGSDGGQGPAGNDGSPGPAGSSGSDGVSVVNVYDSGDGRAIVALSNGQTFGPFSVAGGPAGPPGDRGSDGSPGPAGNDGAPGSQGPAGNDGRSVVNVRDSGDGRAIVDMSDGSSYGPFYVASGPSGPQGPAGNDGRSLTMRGDWNSWTGYNPGDVTAYNGNVYLAMDYASGTTPDADGRWRLMSIVGPAGPQGGGGPPGDSGPAGPEGPQGQPGEVSNQQLSDAIAGTPHNPSSIGQFTGSFSDPPTQAEMQAYAAWGESLRQALIR